MSTPAAYPAAANAQQAAPSNTLGIVSLVLGLVSIFAGWTFLAPIAGLVLGIMALSREPHNRTMAIWGIVLNAVLLAGSVLLAVLAIVAGIAFLPFLPFMAL
jgi:CHASE2 domain-containing sensor protein